MGSPRVLCGRLCFITRPPLRAVLTWERPMIAFAKKCRSAAKGIARNTPAWHAGFLKLLPAIQTHLQLCFRHLDPEAQDEAVQEAVANAMVAYARLADLGKENLAYASPLARYAVSQYLDGRRVTGRNVRDVLSSLCQRVKGIVVQRLDYYDEETGQWQELIVEDRHATPAEVATVRIDFQDWLRTLPRRERRVAMKLAVGESTSGVAKLFQITAGRVSQLRRELFDRWQEFQGEAVLAAA